MTGTTNVIWAAGSYPVDAKQHFIVFFKFPRATKNSHFTYQIPQDEYRKRQLLHALQVATPFLDLELAMYIPNEK